MVAIKEDEWLSELARLSQRSDAGFTAEEWAEKMNRSVKNARDLLKKAARMGWLAIGKRTSAALDGRTYQATVYRISKPKRGTNG